MTCGVTIGSKGEDVFLLSRGDGMHVGLGDLENAGPSYICTLHSGTI
jgi:hypothetical protein